MKFILDANISREVAEYLRTKFSHEFISIQDTNPHLDDEEILELAVEEDAVIITNDKDFGELVFRRKMPHKGILLLRVEELSYNEVKLLLVEILQMLTESLKNKFSVYQNGRIRMR